VKVEERYQLAARFRRRDLAAGRAQRSELLTVFCEVTGYGRKHAVCVLRGRPRKRADGHGRPRAYSEEFTQALRGAVGGDLLRLCGAAPAFHGGAGGPAGTPPPARDLRGDPGPAGPGQRLHG
jgi:hypothetical protein